jgi:hypothetical protein
MAGATPRRSTSLLGAMTSRVASIFIVTLTARPTLQLEGYAKFGGAHVNCWIDANGMAAAVAQAEKEVRAAAWTPGTVDSVRSVTSKDYADDIAGRKYFEQAIVDGVVIVFHTWPRGSDAHSDLH